MRIFIITFLMFVVSVPSYACFCIASSFCDYFEELKEDETRLIFKGSYLQEEDLEFGSKAMQFKIEKIYHGEIVLEDSPYYEGETYINTDSTVWLKDGSDSYCLRYLEETTAVFAVTYNTGWPSVNPDIGYVPTVCASDYFPISDNDDVSDWIFEWGVDVTIPFIEFEALLEEGCMLTSIEQPIDVKANLNIYPNPFKDFINFEFQNSDEIVKKELYNTSGDLVKIIRDSYVDLSDLKPGIYYLVASDASSSYTKKIVKI